MVSHNNICECNTMGRERMLVSCLWCYAPHQGGNPRGQTEWCRCQCHWLMILPNGPCRNTLGICWGCMAGFCSGAYDDAYKLDRLRRLLDRITVTMRRQIELASRRGTTEEVRRPAHGWGGEGPSIGSSSTSAITNGRLRDRTGSSV